MVKRRDRPGLALEPLARLRTHGQMRRQDLDRHVALQTRVARKVHFAHAARTYHFSQLIWSQTCAGCWGHGSLPESGMLYGNAYRAGAILCRTGCSVNLE